LSNRWLTGAEALDHISSATRGGFRNISIRLTRSRRLPGGIQRGLGEHIGIVGAIAAAGRSGVEEVYGVPYLDVGCDVCFHDA